MPRTDEAEAWYDAVYRCIQLIPLGRVTTYGHIAYLLDYPQRARQVGVCLKHLPSYDAAQPDLHFHHSDNVPWQRVLNAKGGISPREAGGVARQAGELRAEGIEVEEDRGLGGCWVDLNRWGWFPDSVDIETGEVEGG